MQVNNTLQQSLSRVATAQRRNARPGPIDLPTAGQPAEEVEFSHLEAPIQNRWQNPAQGAESEESVLTNGEKSIIDLMFNIPEGAGQKSYGPQKPRPVPIGNFIDLRG
jgi:hypothetical protein